MSSNIKNQNIKGIPFYPEEKLAIFIDGSNLYAAAKALDFDIDYKALLKWSTEQGRLVRSFYYTAIIEDQEYSPIKPLVDWLDYNGYSMVTKPTREYIDSEGRRKVKGNIEAVQRKGVRVTVVSTIRTKPPMVSDDLRRQADHFLDLDILGDYIAREDFTPTPKHKKLETAGNTKPADNFVEELA